MVIGTRDSIFDWMKCHENLACEFSTFQTTMNTFKISPVKKLDPLLRFELYDDEAQNNGEEQHHIDGHSRKNLISLIRPFFSPGTGTKKYNGSSKMRLEISVHDYNKHHSDQSYQHRCKSSTPVMKTEVVRGTRLLHVLNDWQDQLNLEQIKKSYDYEL